ncbi:MAG: DUF167 family protein [Candidatus Melainabacteria bacterium]|nr:DUF167 family protein [Candidatus Melainabacteria bacterium]
MNQSREPEIEHWQDRATKLGPEGLTLEIIVSPGAKQEGFCGTRDGIPVLKVRQRPVDGAANEAVLKRLSKLLSLRLSAFKLVQGTTSRRKIIKIDGNPVEIKNKLQALIEENK